MSKTERTNYLLAALVVIVIFFVVSISHRVEQSNQKNRLGYLNSCGAQTDTMITSQVDSSSDYKAMGYIDQRKIVRLNDTSQLVTFRKKDSSQRNSYQIYVSRSTDNGLSWQLTNNQKPISKGSGDFDQRVADIVANGNEIYLVWYGSDGSLADPDRHEIKFARSTDNGLSWRPWVNIGVIDGYSDEDTWQEHPKMQVENDNILIVWEGKNEQNSKQQIMFARSNDRGSSWTEPSILKSDFGNTQSRPTLIRAADKWWVAAYTNDKNQKQKIIISNSDNGSDWKPWQVISDTSKDSRHVSLAYYNDQITTLYREQNGNNSEIVYQFINPDTGKITERNKVGTSKNAQLFPSSGVIDNKLTVVWTEVVAPEAELPKDDINSLSQLRIASFSNGKWNLISEVAGGRWGSIIQSSKDIEIVFAGNPKSGDSIPICYSRITNADKSK